MMDWSTILNLAFGTAGVGGFISAAYSAVTAHRMSVSKSKMEGQVTQATLELQAKTAIFNEYEHLMDLQSKRIQKLEANAEMDEKKLEKVELALVACQQHHRDTVIENTYLRENQGKMQVAINELRHAVRNSENVKELRKATGALLEGGGSGIHVDKLEVTHADSVHVDGNNPEAGTSGNWERKEEKQKSATDKGGGK